MQEFVPTPLTIDGVTMRFPEVVAVDDANIEVGAGEFFTLLGPSGCGKTTLLRTIAGFLQQSAGGIYFGDERIDEVAPFKRDTGMVFQSYAVFPHLNVWNNVAYGLKARKVSKDESAERIRQVLKLVDLDGLEERMPRELSGGQQQRVVVARAIVIRPRILLMDEPLANLDAKLRVRLRSELRELQQDLGITTIYVTHDQEEALSISDRIAVMSLGKVMQIGTPEEVYEQPTSQNVAAFVGEGNFLPGRIQEVGEAHYRIALASGPTVEVSAEAGTLLGGRGDVVTAGFRPHDVEVVGDGEVAAVNEMSGVVRDLMYFGSVARFEVELGDGEVVQAEQYAPAGKPLPKPGEPLRLRVARERVLLFDADGTRLGRRA